MQRTYTFSADRLPVSEALFGRIVRSPVADIGALVAPLPAVTRARLALFCNVRAHLHDLALVITATCSEFDLAQEGGYAGSVLFEQAKVASTEAPAGLAARKAVSLPKLRVLGSPLHA